MGIYKFIYRYSDLICNGSVQESIAEKWFCFILIIKLILSLFLFYNLSY
jgi:hypothetical protein